MKKYFYLALMCLASVAMFTACKNGNVVNGTTVNDIDLSTLDKKTEKCWEISASHGTYSETLFEWGTEYDIVLILKESQKLAGSMATYSYKANSAKDEETCNAQNPDYEQHACYEVTINMGAGATMTSYMWDTESGISEFSKIYKSQGWTVTFKKADAKDEASCEALNE